MSTFVMLWSCNKSSSSSAKTTRYVSNVFMNFSNTILGKPCSRKNRKYSILVSLQNEFATNNENDNVSSSFKDTVVQQLHSFCQFSRPQTVIGTVTYGITSVSLLPVETISELSPTFFMGLLKLPLLGWKKQAFLAATCIMIVRAIVVQLAFFVHMQDQQGHGTANIKSKVSPSIQHLFAWRVLQESSRLFINIYSVNCKLSSF
ncbi:hypothetical protein Peur_046291 [Populus x canadensis]